MKLIIYIFAASMLFLSSCHEPSYISVLMPENFRGQVFILYNQKGCTDEIVGDTLILRIPNNGVVKTSSNNPSWNISCYSLDKYNNRRKIKWFSNINDESGDDTSRVHCLAMGINYDGDPIQSFFFPKEPSRYHQDQTDSLRKALNK